MDWQQPVALGIVVITAGLMLWYRVRRASRLGAPAGGCGCGCPASTGEAPTERILYRARRGERPQLVVRSGRDG